MRQALRHQSFDPSAIHGVTQFSDLTLSEFREAFLGLGRNRLRLPVDTNTASILLTENLPIHFDWRERGAVTAVKNQVPYYISNLLFNGDFSSSRRVLILVLMLSFWRIYAYSIWLPLISVFTRILICGSLKDNC